MWLYASGKSLDLHFRGEYLFTELSHKLVNLLTVKLRVNHLLIRTKVTPIYSGIITTRNDSNDMLEVKMKFRLK